jgi:hypothetical protein
VVAAATVPASRIAGILAVGRCRSARRGESHHSGKVLEARMRFKGQLYQLGHVYEAGMPM